MKYGYTLNSNAGGGRLNVYQPYFDKEDGSGPQYFRVRHLGNGLLLSVVRSLAELSAPRRWEDGQYYLETNDKNTPEEDKFIFFTDPIYIHAFLGAAKYQIDQRMPIEVKEP